ncbi:MAG: hypothetical protein R3232_11165 [Clostridia bacterium]|nr:hypothetical protein [Clostridia bacterium]
MKTRNIDSLKSFLLLFFSFTFANSVTVAIHELGHAILIAACGNKVRVILHPYLSSRVLWNPTLELFGYVDAAGPLFNILISTIILAVLWKFRKPVLMPLILMAPLSYFQEGFSSFMQIILNQQGTDSIRMIRSGVPMVILLVVSIALLLFGIFLFVAMFPLFNIKKEYSFGRVFSIVYGATGLNMIIMLLFALQKGMDEITRALILLAGMLIFSLIFTSLHKLYFSKRIVFKIRETNISNVDIYITFSIALIAVISGIIYYHLIN